MTDMQYTCLKVAVTLAKTEQIKKFSDDDITAALAFWAKQERKTA